jgi:uncharacterized membrane protein
MAGQKARPASGRAKSGGNTARNSSGGTGSARTGSARTGSGGGRAAQDAPVRGGGKNGRPSAGQGGQNGNRGPGGRVPGGRPGPGGPAGPQGRAGAQLADSPAVQADDDRYSVPAWLQWASLVLSLAGLGVSIYLTIAHYTSTSILACSNKGFIDCAKVTTSSQSMVFGVLPVAVLGLAFYVFMVAVNSPWGWRLRVPLVWWARLGSVVVGIGFVLYLIYAEVIQIGNICLWCTSVHAITFLLFGLLVFASTMNSGPAARDAR